MQLITEQLHDKTHLASGGGGGMGSGGAAPPAYGGAGGGQGYSFGQGRRRGGGGSISDATKRGFGDWRRPLRHVIDVLFSFERNLSSPAHRRTRHEPGKGFEVSQQSQMRRWRWAGRSRRSIRGWLKHTVGGILMMADADDRLFLMRHLCRYRGVGRPSPEDVGGEDDDILGDPSYGQWALPFLAFPQFPQQQSQYPQQQSQHQHQQSPLAPPGGAPPPGDGLPPRHFGGGGTGGQQGEQGQQGGYSDSPGGEEEAVLDLFVAALHVLLDRPAPAPCVLPGSLDRKDSEFDEWHLVATTDEQERLAEEETSLLMLECTSKQSAQGGSWFVPTTVFPPCVFPLWPQPSPALSWPTFVHTDPT